MNQPVPLYDLSEDVQRLLVRHPLAFVLVAMAAELNGIANVIAPPVPATTSWHPRAEEIRRDAHLLMEMVPKLSRASSPGPYAELKDMAHGARVISKGGFIGVEPRVPDLPPALETLDPPPTAKEVELYLQHGYLPVRGLVAEVATFGEQPFFFRAMFTRRPGELVLRVSHEVARALSDEVARGIITTLELPSFGARAASTHRAKVIAYATRSAEEGTDLVFVLDPKAEPPAAPAAGDLHPIPPVVGSRAGEDLAAIVASRAGIPVSEVYVAPPAMAPLQPGDAGFLIELVAQISHASRALLPESMIPSDSSVMRAVERWPVAQQTRVMTWMGNIPVGSSEATATWWSAAPRVIHDFFDSLPGMPSAPAVHTALRNAEILTSYGVPTIGAIALLTPMARTVVFAWARSRPNEGWWDMRPEIINADSAYNVCAALQEVMESAPSLETITSWNLQERCAAFTWACQVGARTGRASPPVPEPMPELLLKHVFAAPVGWFQGGPLNNVLVPRVFDLLIVLQGATTMVPPIATMVAWEPEERVAIHRWALQKPTTGEDESAVEAWLLGEPHALRIWRRTDAHQPFSIYAHAWNPARTPIVAEVVEALDLTLTMPRPTFMGRLNTRERWAILLWVAARPARGSARGTWLTAIPGTIGGSGGVVVPTIEDVLAAFDEIEVAAGDDVLRVPAAILRAFRHAAVRDLSFEDRSALIEWAEDGAPVEAEPALVRDWRWRAGLFVNENERTFRMTKAALDLSEAIDGIAVPSLAIIQTWADEDREDAMAWARNKPLNGDGNLGRWMLDELPPAMWVFFRRLRTEFTTTISAAPIDATPLSATTLRQVFGGPPPETTGAVETVASLEAMGVEPRELDPRQMALYQALAGSLGEAWADEVEVFFGRPAREVGLPEMAAWAAIEHPGEIVPMLSAWGKLSILMRDDEKPRVDFFRDRLVGDVAPAHQQALEAFFGMQLDELPISTIAAWVAFYHPEDIAPLLTAWRPIAVTSAQSEEATRARSTARFQIAIETMLRRHGWTGRRFIWATLPFCELVRISVRTELASEYLSTWMAAEAEATALHKLFDTVVTMVGRWVAGQHDELGDVDAQDVKRIVVDHLLAEGHRHAAGPFEHEAANATSVAEVAALAETMLIPGELSFSVWERLRPGLGLQKNAAAEVMKVIDLNFGHPSTRVYFEGTRVVEVFYEGYPIGHDRWQKLETSTAVPVLDWAHVAVRRAGAGLTVLSPLDAIGQEQLIILADLAEHLDRPGRDALRWAIERVQLASRVLLDGPVLSESNWTLAADGKAPAPFFLRIAEDVERMIREGAQQLLGGHTNVLAQHIVHRLAHHHLLGPQRAELDLITKRHQVALRVIRDLNADAEPIDYVVALLRGLITASAAAQARGSNPKMLPVRAAMEAAILRLESGHHPRPAVAAILEAEAAFHRLSSTAEWLAAVEVSRTTTAQTVQAVQTFEEARAHHQIAAAVSGAAMRLCRTLEDMKDGLTGGDMNGTITEFWARIMILLNEPTSAGDSPIPLG